MSDNFGRLLSLALLIASGAASASAYEVKGLVTDSIGEPEPFATYRITPATDSTKVTLGVADENGLISKNIPDAGQYAIVVSAVGKQAAQRQFDLSDSEPVADLGEIVMTTFGRSLDEVQVTAVKPLVSREIDRIGYDVQSDPDKNTSQLDEMLKKVPMVTVDADGTVKVKGSTSFTVYKNGRKNNAFTSNSKDIFKSIPASMIKRIEVITDPGAREDAEGVSTILNIVTEENMIIKGVMGSASLSWNHTRNIPSPHVWVMSQIDKVTFSVFGSYYDIPSRSGKNISETYRTYDDSGNRSAERNEAHTGFRSTNVGMDLSYEMDSLNLFTAEFFAYIGNNRSRNNYHYEMVAPDDNIIYGYENPSRTRNNNHFLDGTFNYQRLTRHKDEKIIASYRISGNGGNSISHAKYDNVVGTLPVAYKGIDSDSRTRFLEHTLQVDWSRPLAKGHTLDVGGKYVYRDNHSKAVQNYIDLHEVNTDFSHVTQIGALYADYRLNISKFGLRAGARYEYSRLAAKFHDDSNPDFHSTLNDVVPNAAVMYNINDRNSLRLSYSSSISRPGIYYLNPVVNESPTTISQGNPNLKSQRLQSANLNYSFFSSKISLDFNAGYRFCNNEIIEVRSLLPNDRIMTTYANAGRSHSFYFGLWGSWQASSKTRIMINASVNNDNVENTTLGIKGSYWNPWIYLRGSQQLPWKLSIDAYVMYRNGWSSLYNRSSYAGIDRFEHGLDLGRSFLKEDRLKVRINFINPFGRSISKSRSHLVNLPYQSNSYSYSYNNQTVGITVSYRFGNLQAQVKKVRSVQNDDIVGGAQK